MNLTICICTYNRNNSLQKCIESINKIINRTKININIIIIDNSKNFNVLKIKKKLIKMSNYKLLIFNEKKRGIVHARNKLLTKLKKIVPNYISFFDDDCIVDKFWLINSYKTIKKYKADIVTGPQIYLKNNSKHKLINYSKFFEKIYNKKICSVKWAASNNILMKYSIIKKNNIFFDVNLNKFGIGEDQLFFSLLKKFGCSIFWNKNVKVFEKEHKHRLNLRWLVKRSFRLGVLGHYIDKKIYGTLIGYILNFIKSFFYLSKAIVYIFFIFEKNYTANLVNFFSRFIGRVSGPFIFTKINFLNK